MIKWLKELVSSVFTPAYVIEEAEEAKKIEVGEMWGWGNWPGETNDDYCPCALKIVVEVVELRHRKHFTIRDPTIDVIYKNRYILADLGWMRYMGNWSDYKKAGLGAFLATHKKVMPDDLRRIEEGIKVSDDKRAAFLIR